MSALFLVALAVAGAYAISDGFSDVRPPKDAVGRANREPGFDVLPGFRTPPSGFGEVAFYWWVGDPLTKERLTYQLDQLSNKHVSGLQINYAHSSEGGQLWGLTYPSDPPLFSPKWWELVHWFMAEAKKRGMAVSLSDYTLGIGQGSYMDEILKENPGIEGAVLRHETREAPGGSKVDLSFASKAVSVVAFKAGFVSRVDLLGKRSWEAPEGSWRIEAVFADHYRSSVDPMNPKTAQGVIKHFFQPFEDHNPGEGGKGLNYFFSDELNFGVGGNLWNDRFLAEFHKRKGYDLRPELAGLFVDIGPRTPKVRMDYRDVMVALQEEAYFKPVYDWHEQRGMIYGCDHGGRGRDVTEFGDYFRTQRWNQGPGCDQPQLSSDVVKNKVASSIAHLYERPRTWLEGYHSSGWGTGSNDVADATFRNFIGGQNLLTMHGLYYTTHGSFWEWAPPCNHFRMPYWMHMGEFFACSERLSYLLSQGRHRCDVAIVYPVAPMEAGLDGQRAVDAAFRLGEEIFNKGIDFDFIDHQSLERAKSAEGKLRVSGEEYSVLVLPAMSAARHSTMKAALEFKDAGGTVVALDVLPVASDRAGRNDPELDKLNKAVFGEGLPSTSKGKNGGLGLFTSSHEDVFRLFDGESKRDFLAPNGGGEVLHRVIGKRDVFFVRGVPKGSECFFRAKGKVELWDPWTGSTRELLATRSDGAGTWVTMPLLPEEPTLIVFSLGEPKLRVEKTDLVEVTKVSEAKGKVVVEGFSDQKGVVAASARNGRKIVRLKGVSDGAETVTLDGPWGFELVPTMDNRFGDFRLPATTDFIGAEARQFAYAEQESQPRDFRTTVTAGFGQHFWRLGPLKTEEDSNEILGKLLAMTSPKGVTGLTPYSYSTRFGVEGDPGPQGYHGLKELVSDKFICLGLPQTTVGMAHQRDADELVAKRNGKVSYLWTTVSTPTGDKAKLKLGGSLPTGFWLNGKPVQALDNTELTLNQGVNTVLARYEEPVRGYLVLDKIGAAASQNQTPLSMSWYDNPDVFRFEPLPGETKPVCWYQFLAPPALASLEMVVHGEAEVLVGGKSVPLAREGDTLMATLTNPTADPVSVIVKVTPQPGYYGGEAIPEPIKLTCTKGLVPLGDWSNLGVLRDYSGAARYTKALTLTNVKPGSQVLLDLGNVACSAEVKVNGKKAGVRVVAPYAFDISSVVHEGENQIEVLVANTLANHYRTSPTPYKGKLTSGLIGPVQVTVRPKLVLSE